MRPINFTGTGSESGKTIQVYPLQNGDAVYGAVLSGEHVFYLLDKGKPERLDGRARFTHLWLLGDRGWKMARVLSYDHGPAADVSRRRACAIDPAEALPLE